MKWKDRAADVKPFKEIMSGLAMSKGDISRFKNRELLITDICMPWFDCHTHVVFQITNVLFFNFTSSSHTLMIVNPLLIYLNTNLYLTRPNIDMISLRGLTSAALSFHFMINCHYLSLSPIEFEYTLKGT